MIVIECIKKWNIASMRKKEKEMRACGLDVCVMQEIGEALSIVLTIF